MFCLVFFFALKRKINRNFSSLEARKIVVRIENENLARINRVIRLLLEIKR